MRNFNGVQSILTRGYSSTRARGGIAVTERAPLRREHYQSHFQ